MRLLSWGGAAVDYDISNDYGRTDVMIDLFDQIDRAYMGLSSVFDKIRPTDFVFAFFPCTEFEDQKGMLYLGNLYQLQKADDIVKLNYCLLYHEKLHADYMRITKMAIVFLRKNIPAVIENPKGTSHYLTRYWPIKPKVIDADRRKDGDAMKKPTQYWFLNVEPKQNLVIEPLNLTLTCRVEYIGGNGGNRQRKRSEITPQYAERFIKKYVADFDGENFSV